ncbi:DMT family transporter [Marivita geojedonensis]|uniref:Membrane protein n=1 Tax=Marivita geojedonensis TaxID=1123756 RepID=A0A1X4NF82_9RHOB|nr:DMT family transporter [Marivita geojedonensis]OSQ45638.1 membrane protein [Marivita geojedonensis]PRY73977.1 EamA-like transporter family protein [Marivita geojedonensis]
MELWILASVAAALFQTVRFMLQKVLSIDVLSTAGSTFARFAYAAPAALVVMAVYLWAQGSPVPVLDGWFWFYAWLGAISQILATICVVALFRQRNFAVGITFKKTEVIQTAIVGVAFFGAEISLAGWGAILIGLIGVLLLSRTPGLELGVWKSLSSRATVLGLTSGFFFAFSGTGYRAASLQIDSEDALLRAGVTLVCVTASQFIGMALWLRWREPGQLTAVWRARRVAVWVGLTSMAGSLGWFTAFTLQTAAYVQAVGQIELIFSLLASVLFFRETVTSRELIGIGFLALSILTFILVI